MTASLRHGKLAKDAQSLRIEWIVGERGFRQLTNLIALLGINFGGLNRFFRIGVRLFITCRAGPSCLLACGRARIEHDVSAFQQRYRIGGAKTKGRLRRGIAKIGNICS